ncbi:unnamed protein product [Symbiodinium necroappetens]|uniref:Uncharacterized protein n=1 Tax=Symbiodinium necroappetens TaxID=1628268 RepID=A0A812YMC4_9DINO|nr:unnamed protein product [Symbiodinium necroappetens]
MQTESPIHVFTKCPAIQRAGSFASRSAHELFRVATRQPLQSDSQWSRSAACISFAPGVHTGLISERITVHCCCVECLSENMLRPFYPMHGFHDESARQNCSSGLSHCECTCEWYMRRNYCKRTVSGATAVSPKSAPIPELQWVLAKGTCGLCCSL